MNAFWMWPIKSLRVFPWIVLERLWETIARGHSPEQVERDRPLWCLRCMAPAPCDAFIEAHERIDEAGRKIAEGLG